MIGPSPWKIPGLPDSGMGMPPPPTGQPSPTFPTGAPGSPQGPPNFFSRLMQALARLNQDPNAPVPTGPNGQQPAKKKGIAGALSSLKGSGDTLNKFKPPIDINQPNQLSGPLFTRY
jgi:hypothetical protein